MKKASLIIIELLRFKYGIVNSVTCCLLTILAYLLLIINGYNHRNEFCPFPAYISDYCSHPSFGYFTMIIVYFSLLIFVILNQNYYNLMRKNCYNSAYSLAIYFFSSIIIIFNLETLLFPNSVFPTLHSIFATILFISGCVLSYLLFGVSIINIKRFKKELNQFDYISLIIRIILVTISTVCLLCQLIPTVLIEIYNIEIVDCDTPDWNFNLHYLQTTSEWGFPLSLAITYLTLAFDFAAAMRRKHLLSKCKENSLIKFITFKQYWVPGVVSILFRVAAFVALVITGEKSEFFKSILDIIPIRYFILDRSEASYFYSFIYISCLTFFPFVLRRFQSLYLIDFKFLSTLLLIFGVGFVFSYMASFLVLLSYHVIIQIGLEILYYVLGTIYSLLSIITSFVNCRKVKYHNKCLSTLKWIEMLNFIFICLFSVLFITTRIFIFWMEDDEYGEITDPRFPNMLKANSAGEYLWQLFFTIQMILNTLQLITITKNSKGRYSQITRLSTNLSLSVKL